MLVALWLVVTIQFGLVLWLGADKLKRGGSGPKALSTSHDLHKVYYQRSDFMAERGWAWRCSCGVNALINSYSNTSEERALSAWKKHKALYTELALETGENPYKVLYEDKQAELEKVKAACYCKDIH
jgi:hypothetical protein